MRTLQNYLEVIFLYIILLLDEEIVKKHDNLRTLLKRKQKGFIVDTSSERALTKTWAGVLVNSFEVEKRQVVYKA